MRRVVQFRPPCPLPADAREGVPDTPAVDKPATRLRRVQPVNDNRRAHARRHEVDGLPRVGERVLHGPVDAARLAVQVRRADRNEALVVKERLRRPQRFGADQHHWVLLKPLDERVQLRRRRQVVREHVPFDCFDPDVFAPQKPIELPIAKAGQGIQALGNGEEESRVALAAAKHVQQEPAVVRVEDLPESGLLARA